MSTKSSDMNNQHSGGVKLDDGKLRFDLVPTSALDGLAEVFTMGANKYTPNGWRTVPNARVRYYSALMRHLQAWRKGEEVDPESGLSHLKHAITNVAFLLELDNDSTNSKEDGSRDTVSDNVSTTNTDDWVFQYCGVCGDANAETVRCNCDIVVRD